MNRKMQENGFNQPQIAHEYERSYQTKYRKADVQEKKLIVQLLKEFPNSESVLEVGCGTGHFTRWMQSSLSKESIGVDKSKPMLEEAKRLWPNGRLVRASSSCLPLKEKSVDVVAFVASLEFMEDVAGALQEAERIAKDGMILGLLNKQSISAIGKEFAGATKKCSLYRWAKFYSLREIRKVLEDTLSNRYEISFWATTLFPKPFQKIESSIFPFGGFLGVAVKFRDNDE